MQQFFISGHSNGHGTVNPNNRLPSTNGRSSDSYSPHNTPSTPNKHVNFGGQGPSEERKREKFLTAKYGAHQMALIRKRLRVEMWMYERLQELYGAVSYSLFIIFSKKNVFVILMHFYFHKLLFSPDYEICTSVAVDF